MTLMNFDPFRSFDRFLGEQRALRSLETDNPKWRRPFPLSQMLLVRVSKIHFFDIALANQDFLKWGQKLDFYEDMLIF